MTHYLLRSSRRTFRSLATRQELGGSCGITVATKTSTGSGDKDMRNVSGKEEEEDVLKQERQDRGEKGIQGQPAGNLQEVKLRDISETGVLLIHIQGAFKLSLKSET
ncbi:hypothetical protein EDB87DRAFT_1581668 [Lactarius vividus]|nr:hypothetical protein EDB87DRAFT_1581668 [Lactarius vividus]